MFVCLRYFLRYCTHLRRQFLRHTCPNVRSNDVCSFHSFPLLKGEYYLYVFLLCEKGIHVYDFAHAVAKVTVRQNDIEQGVVSVPHSWIRDEDKSYDEG